MKLVQPISFFSLVTKLVSISIFVSLCTLITSLIVAKFTSQDIFGQYSFYQSIYLLLLNLLPFGFSMAVVVFKNKVSNVEYSALLSYALNRVVPATSLLVSILVVCFLVLTGSYERILTFLVLIFYAATQSVLVILFASLRVSYQLKKLARVMFLNSVLTLITSVVYFMNYEDFLMFYLVISFVSVLTILITYLFENAHDGQGATLTFLESRNYIVFGWPVAVHAVFSSFLVAGDKVVLGLLTDSTQLGFYAYASTASSLFLFVVNNYASSWGVHLSNFIARSSAQEIREYYKKNFYYPFFFLFLVPPFFFVIWFFSLFYEIQKVRDFYIICCFLTMSYCFYAITKYYMGYLNSLNKTLLVMKSTVISCVSLVLFSFILFGYFGLVGVSIAVFASFFINMCCNLYTSRNVVRKL